VKKKFASRSAYRDRTPLGFYQAVGLLLQLLRLGDQFLATANRFLRPPQHFIHFRIVSAPHSHAPEKLVAVVDYFDSRRLKLCHSEPSPSDGEEPALRIDAQKSK
jgi:hypothetical protein